MYFKYLRLDFKRIKRERREWEGGGDWSKREEKMGSLNSYLLEGMKPDETRRNLPIGGQGSIYTGRGDRRLAGGSGAPQVQAVKEQECIGWTRGRRCGAANSKLRPDEWMVP